MAHYWGEVSRSGAERSAEHVNGYKRKQEDNPFYKHKILHHPEEEVTFTMSIVKRHQTPLPRFVLEAVLIEMGEKNGSWILNSKNSFNRASIPRISITVNDKIHSEQPETKENLTDKDIEEIFENKKKKDRKKTREDSDTGASHHHLPSSKRRKKSIAKHDNIDRVEPSRNEENSNMNDPRVTCPASSNEEHKQGSNLKLFSIFTKPRPELKGKRRVKNISDKKNPPNFKYLKISDHFKPQIGNNSKVRPDDPGMEGEPSAGESL